ATRWCYCPSGCSAYRRPRPCGRLPAGEHLSAGAFAHGRNARRLHRPLRVGRLNTIACKQTVGR
ncbi:unnamed protein product, partial [Musa textilis]